MDNLKNTIIYLIGFAGVGKLAIAKELAKIGDVRIVDNHLINNPVFNVLDLTDGVPDSAWSKTGKIRDVVFETINEYSPADMSFIFTNELFEGSKGDSYMYERVEKLAGERGSQFFPVRLLADAKQHKKRIVSDGRKEMRKLSDEEYVESLVFNEREVLKIDHKNVITIDTTNLSAKESAEYIMKEFKEKQCQ